jgi:RNA polymerase sigma factor (sigma-70 family)
MLPRRQDAEDALQDIFVRAYSGLRANHRELALRAWLYRVAHNRCIDELRRPAPPPPEVIQLLRAPEHDPIAEADQRESLRRLIADVRRLPDQQRSALLMRELGGMSYADLSVALGVTVPAVKSLLVRARLALGQALAARDTACSEIREELIVAHDRGLRPGATARRHMRDCSGCRDFRHQLRGVSRRFGAIVPTLGPLGVLANLLGVGGAGGGAAGGAAGGALAAGGAAGTSTAVVSVGALSAGAGHVATLLAAAVVTAGGAVELQQTLPTPVHHHHARVVKVAPAHRAAVIHTAATSAASSDPAPSVPVSPLVDRPQTPVAAASGDSAKASTKSGALASNSTSITTTTPVKVKLRATGGTSMPLSGGGVSPTAPSNSSTSTTTGGSSTTPTQTPTSTGATSTATTGTPGDPTSTTPDGSTATIPPTSSSSTSTGSTSPGTTSGTGSSTGTAAGSSPPPAQ